MEDIIEEVVVVAAEEQEKVFLQEQEEAPEEQDWGLLQGLGPRGTSHQWRRWGHWRPCRWS